jgi:hypothetical protein
MNERDRDAFRRWQGRTLDQFSFVSNVILGLASAGLGLSANALLNGKVPSSGMGRWLFLGAVCLCGFSVTCGLALAWNRLLDFAKTMQTVKARRKSLGAAKALRKDSRELGRGSWRLLLVQSVLLLPRRAGVHSVRSASLVRSREATPQPRAADEHGPVRRPPRPGGHGVPRLGASAAGQVSRGP